MSPHVFTLPLMNKPLAAATTTAYGAANMVALGERLRFLREERGLSKAEVGRRAGMPRQAIHAYERGTRQNLTLANVYALAEALEVSVSELLEDVDPPDDEKKTTPTK